MFSENECCYLTGVTMEEFPDDCNDVEYYEWAKVDGKVKKVVKSVDVEEAIELFNKQVKILKAHIFVKRTKNTHYNRLTENLKANEFIIHIDYSEITKIRNKTKSKVLISGIIRCQYLRRVGTHAGLIVQS